jgi:hypothetical protein
LYILNVMLLDSRWDDKIFPEFNLLFIPSWLQIFDLSHSQIFELCHIFRGSIRCHSMILASTVAKGHEHLFSYFTIYF